MRKLASLFFILLALPSTAHAQGAASGLYGVKDVTIQYVHFADPKASGACGLTREDIATLLMKALQADSVPATAAAEGKPPAMGVARIDLLPEIASVDAGGLDCTSWVSLTAQSQNNLHIPPIETLRSVSVVYWHQGAMVASGQSTHQRYVSDLLQKMAQNFTREYRIAQPPELPSP